MFIAYVDDTVDTNKKIAIARVLGNEGIRGAIERVSSQIGYTPLVYPIIATTPEEAKNVVTYSFGEDRYFINAFNKAR